MEKLTSLIAADGSAIGVNLNKIIKILRDASNPEMVLLIFNHSHSIVRFSSLPSHIQKFLVNAEKWAAEEAAKHAKNSEG